MLKLSEWAECGGGRKGGVRRYACITHIPNQAFSSGYTGNAVEKYTVEIEFSLGPLSLRQSGTILENRDVPVPRSKILNGLNSKSRSRMQLAYCSELARSTASRLSTRCGTAPKSRTACFRLPRSSRCQLGTNMR